MTVIDGTADELERGLRRLVAHDRRVDVEDVKADVRRIRGGMSREAWYADIFLPEGVDHHCVVMRNAPGGMVDSDIADEFRVLKQLAGTGVPVPRPLWLDEHGAWIGSPGFVMERVSGSSDIRMLPEGSTAERDELDAKFLKTMVQIHGSRWPDGWQERSHEQVATRELRRWKKSLGADGASREPGLAEALEWLERNAPTAESLVLVHGDYRYGNLMIDGQQITAVLDWELAHIGDPAEDLVWAYRPFRPGTGPASSLPELASNYERMTGYPVRPRVMAYYRVFAEVKTAIIYIRGIRAFIESGEDDLAVGVPGQLVPYCTRQALRWIDELQER